MGSHTKPSHSNFKVYNLRGKTRSFNKYYTCSTTVWYHFISHQIRYILKRSHFSTLRVCFSLDKKANVTIYQIYTNNLVLHKWRNIYVPRYMPKWNQTCECHKGSFQFLRKDICWDGENSGTLWLVLAIVVLRDPPASLDSYEAILLFSSFFTVPKNYITHKWWIWMFTKLCDLLHRYEAHRWQSVTINLPN